MCPLLKSDALGAKKCGRANRFSLFLPSPTLLALLTYFAHILFREKGVNRARSNCGLKGSSVKKSL